MKEVLYLQDDPDLKVTVDDESDLIAISFNCERLVTATELMELGDWIYEIAKKKYFEP